MARPHYPPAYRRRSHGRMAAYCDLPLLEALWHCFKSSACWPVKLCPQIPNGEVEWFWTIVVLWLWVEQQGVRLFLVGYAWLDWSFTKAFRMGFLTCCGHDQKLNPILMSRQFCCRLVRNILCGYLIWIYLRLIVILQMILNVITDLELQLLLRRWEHLHWSGSPSKGGQPLTSTGDP